MTDAGYRRKLALVCAAILLAMLVSVNEFAQHDVLAMFEYTYAFW